MQQNDSKRRIYGLIGYPVKHSFSPAMHNAAFEALSIDAHYELFEVKPQELNSFLDLLSHRDIYGLNVTIPYKEKVLDFVKLDAESSYVSQIKAINTIVRRDNVWMGLNTDVPGFLRHLRENIEPADKKIAVLGAGGVGKAVVYAVASSKAKQIVVYDIDKDRAKNVVTMIRDLFKGIDIKFVDTVEQLDILNKDLLINATPVGMKDSDPCLVKQEMLHKNLFVYDVIYNPSKTKLLTLAKKVGAKNCNGLGMLLYQGMLSFKIWTERQAPKGVMWKALNSQISFQ
ncbi:MAG: shikimate dehydrogenase [Candidatus Omnitrophica bacterium]|nr:shikimate dehydrogenase [Candidatus Omnitrophota bacterium]